MGKGVRMLTVGEFRAQFGEEAQCAEQLVAVGTSLAARPPRRSVLAELPHTAPAKGRM